MAKSRILATLLLVALIPLAAPVSAQYPARPIRLVPNSSPGTAPDLLARLIGAWLTQNLGQPTVVENRTGGGGNVAAEFVARSPADGYTLLVGADPIFTTNPHVYKKLNFDSNRDLVPVASIMSQDFALCVIPSLPVKTVAEFVDYAKQANPPLYYATAGSGSSSHLAMEMLKARAGFDLVHVPFKGGGAAAMTALLRGEVAATIGGTAALAQVKAGKLRALATTGPVRSRHYPELATVAETLPGYEVVTWVGMFAPTGTPADVIAKLRTEVNRYLALAETREKFAAMGGIDTFITKPEEFAAIIQRDSEKYGKVVRELGVGAD